MHRRRQDLACGDPQHDVLRGHRPGRRASPRPSRSEQDRPSTLSTCAWSSRSSSARACGSTDRRVRRPERPAARSTARAATIRCDEHPRHHRPDPDPVGRGPGLSRCDTLRRDRDRRPRRSRPHQAVVWYRLDGDEIVINSADGRRWPANLRRDPRIHMSVEDGYRYVQVGGRVRRRRRPADRPGRYRRDGPALPRGRARRGRGPHPRSLPAPAPGELPVPTRIGSRWTCDAPGSGPSSGRKGRTGRGSRRPRSRRRPPAGTRSGRGTTCWRSRAHGASRSTRAG